MNEYIKFKKECDDCSSGKFPKDDEKIGKSVVYRTPFGRGHMSTTYSYYQCQICGTLWEHLEDTGAGGYDSYTRKIK